MHDVFGVALGGHCYDVAFADGGVWVVDEDVVVYCVVLEERVSAAHSISSSFPVLETVEQVLPSLREYREGTETNLANVSIPLLFRHADFDCFLHLAGTDHDACCSLRRNVLHYVECRRHDGCSRTCRACDRLVLSCPLSDAVCSTVLCKICV